MRRVLIYYFSADKDVEQKCRTFFSFHPNFLSFGLPFYVIFKSGVELKERLPEGQEENLLETTE